MEGKGIIESSGTILRHRINGWRRDMGPLKMSSLMLRPTSFAHLDTASQQQEESQPEGTQAPEGETKG